jgi:hypothetical protein
VREAMSEEQIDEIARSTDSADDLMAMSDLIEKVRGAETNGGALHAIAAYRKKTRIAAIKRAAATATAKGE